MHSEKMSYEKAICEIQGITLGKKGVISSGDKLFEKSARTTREAPIYSPVKRSEKQSL